MKVKIILEDLTVDEAQSFADQLMDQFVLEGEGFIPKRVMALNSLNVLCKREFGKVEVKND